MNAQINRSFRFRNIRRRAQEMIALIALTGLAALGCGDASSDDGNAAPGGPSAPVADGSSAMGATGRAPQPGVSELAGTWSGRFSDASGASNASTLEFSSAGNLIFKGDSARPHELATSTRFDYLASGGGVTTVIVESVERSPGHLGLRFRIEFTSSGSFLTQTFTEVLATVDLTSNGLRAADEEQKTSFLNGNQTDSVHTRFEGLFTRS